MSSLVRTAKGECTVQTGVIPTRALMASAGKFLRAWRRNIPPGWWVSPACTFCALFYLGIIHILLA